MKNYTIVKGKNKYTPFAGTFLMSDMFNNLNIWNELDKSFKAPGSNRGYKPSAYFKSMISGFYAGADCISDLSFLRNDEALKDIWDMEVPHSSRIGEFINKQGNEETVKISHKIMVDLAIKAIKKKGLTEVTVDVDATFVKSDKQGLSEYCYKKYKALESLFGFIAETGSVIYSEFRTGNVSPAYGLYEQLVYIHNELKKHGIRIKYYRSDAAGYQHDIINFCEENNIEYFIRAKNHYMDYSGIAEWKPFHDRYGIKIDDKEIGETVHAMGKTQAFRLAIIRVPKKDKDGENNSQPELIPGITDYYDYHAVATNSKLSAQKIVNFYSLRGQCEYYIKTVKWDFSLRKLPSGLFYANALWINTALIAHNAFRLFLILTNLNKSLKSIRFRVFSIVGRIVKHGNKTFLKLFPEKDKFDLCMNLKKMCFNL